MRAVNLLPSESRRRGSISGSIGGSHAVIGALAAILIGVLALVLTSSKIADRETEVARLAQEEREARAKADALQPFATFAGMEQARTQTVKSLAESRFDWERVMRELSLVLPDDVWLTKLTGTVVPDVQLEDAAGISARGSIAGPALEVVGCAPGQEAVAGFAAALEDIDGVTRVGVQSSQLPDEATAQAQNSGAQSGASDDCRTRDFISKFEIVVAFDAAPVPAAAAATDAAPTQNAVNPVPGG